MCGIAGIIGHKEGKEELMQLMLEKQAYRGPDARSIWSNENVILGHNRLSIIDLSVLANQPMHSHCGKYTIVFNGEIYNYKELKDTLKDQYTFHTHSDTEVLIASFAVWGNKMLEKLNGMFAFCIWDEEKKSVFAARDRFGVKPFNYSFLDGCLYFASEIKTLWAAGISRSCNTAVWANYFVNGTYGLPHETFWENIHQLPAGHYLEISSNDYLTRENVEAKPWYDFAERIRNTPQLEVGELKEQYHHLLKDSINLRFRSDVPVGFNISGGLDSSTLLAMVNEAFPGKNGIEAFTFYTNHTGYDELPWVEQMIRLTGNPLNECLLTAKNVPSLIERISYQQDEPFGGFPTLAYSLLFEAARKKGILVLLDGQGMDEAWAGYDYYQTNTGHTVQGTISSPVRPEVLKDEFVLSAKKYKYPEPFGNKLQNLQYRDIFYTKIPRALRFNDRISMMHSTELREPFLDYRLVELAFAQKPEVKIQNGQSKWLLRQIVKDLLGNNIALAPKRALQTPQREWINDELHEFVNDNVAQFKTLDFVKPDRVDDIWKKYQNGDNENSFYIWQWININQLVH